jgi:hypothetical protein
MYQTINVYAFRDAFKAMGRGDQFSYDALGMLFDHFEDTAPDAELDVIAICCGYSEDSPQGVADSYGIEIDDLDEGEALDAVMAYLEAHTQVIGVTDAGAIVYYSEF